MATPNYGYEKRQRELAKKNKKADKLREKTERKNSPDGLTEGDTPSQQESVPAAPASE